MQTEHQPAAAGAADCPTCVREKSLALLKEEQVRQWRIESTKQQILDRLEMEDRPPRVKTKETSLNAHQLPGVILTTQIQHAQEQVSPPASQIILFPSKIFRERNRTGSSNSSSSHHHRSERLKFHITEEMFEAVLHSALLWTAQLSNGSSEGTTSAVAFTISTLIQRVPFSVQLLGRLAMLRKRWTARLIHFIGTGT